MTKLNIKDLKMLVCLNQQNLKNEMYHFLESYYGKMNVKRERGFLFVKGEIPVAVVAHLDTVHEELVTNESIVIEDDKMFSEYGIGGDDRCGVYLIYQFVKKGLKPYIILTEDEEKGCIGAQEFTKRSLYWNQLKKCNFIIELDRMNSNDAVFYDCDNQEFQKYILSKGWDYNTGSCSDICYMAPLTNRAAVNLSVGYYNAHTTDEYINLKELNEIEYRVGRLIVEQKYRFKRYEFFEKDDDHANAVKRYKFEN